MPTQERHPGAISAHPHRPAHLLLATLGLPAQVVVAPHPLLLRHSLWAAQECGGNSLRTDKVSWSAFIGSALFSKYECIANYLAHSAEDAVTVF